MFLEKLHGSDVIITQKFFDGWKNDTITIEGRTLALSIDLTSQVTGIPNVGLRFYQSHRILEMTLRSFLNLTLRSCSLRKLEQTATLMCLKSRISGTMFFKW